MYFARNLGSGSIQDAVLHQLLLPGTDERLNFVTWALTQLKRDPQWLLPLCGLMKTTVTSIRKTVVGSSNPCEYLTKLMFSSCECLDDAYPTFCQDVPVGNSLKTES
ncbi:hypothetical protein CDAR_504821 [Caerostris darwini]|uniref:Uncharacterized protein n=1 Tax=Caerostris darwini TaxID=1538125 RepID=A0AAV4T3E1_9ARAC|nr:hypothetical protein CDAR_504821 [Caerostris darwini]